MNIYNVYSNGSLLSFRVRASSEEEACKKALAQFPKSLGQSVLTAEKILINKI